MSWYNFSSSLICNLLALPNYLVFINLGSRFNYFILGSRRTWKVVHSCQHQNIRALYSLLHLTLLIINRPVLMKNNKVLNLQEDKEILLWDNFGQVRCWQKDRGRGGGCGRECWRGRDIQIDETCSKKMMIIIPIVNQCFLSCHLILDGWPEVESYVEWLVQVSHATHPGEELGTGSL